MQKTNELPSFLFTDIQGSTSLWERHPDLMQPALQRHDELLRTAIEENHGRVFKTVGDAFCAVFELCSDAVQAAVRAQQLIAAEPWDAALGTISCRMGIHTGPAQFRDQDYFGTTLNRTSRIEAAAHGGQILLSADARALISDSLIPGIEFLDCGVHRLKDLLRPEQIFQVLASGLRQNFPPLRTLDSVRVHLPAERTPFVGRTREREAVRSLLSRTEVRMVTLTGPGGTGKTRLSLKVAAEISEQFSDGVWFVPLESVTDADGLIRAVANALSVQLPSVEAGAALGTYLHDKSLLLVMDNFEQLVAEAPHIAQILDQAPAVKALFSSRERLRLYGEHEYPVPTLNIPEQAGRITPAVALEYEAIKLFAQRARAVRPDLELNEQNVRTICDICRRLDGLPLAIELASARCRYVPLESIVEGLTRSLDTLSGGARDLPPRQQTIRGAIGWSYQLLTQEEQAVFRALGVCAGGCTPDVIPHLLETQGEPYGIMESLVDKNLVRESHVNGTVRISMLEIVREYAREALEESGELNAVHARHASCYASFADRYGYSIDEERDFTEHFPILYAEIENFRIAMRWSVSSGERERALRLIAPLWQFWHWIGRQSELLGYLNEALTLPDSAPPLYEAHAHRILANILPHSNDPGQLNTVRTLYLKARDLYREAGNTNGVVATIMNTGITMNVEGDREGAIECFSEARDLARSSNNEGALRLAVMNMSTIYAEQERYDDALSALDEAIAIARSSRNRSSVPHVLFAQATVLFQAGRIDSAQETICESITSLVGDRSGVYMLTPVAYTVFLMARIAEVQGRFELAAELLGSMESLVSVSEMAMDRGQKDAYEVICKELKEQLGEDMYARQYENGRQRTTEEVISLARSAMECA